MTNMTNITNINGIYQAGSYINNATNGVFWPLLMLGIFIIITVNLLRHGIERAIAASTFACVTISVLFFYLKWISIWYPVIFALGLAGTLFYIRYTEQ